MINYIPQAELLCNTVILAGKDLAHFYFTNFTEIYKNMHTYSYMCASHATRIKFQCALNLAITRHLTKINVPLK